MDRRGRVALHMAETAAEKEVVDIGTLLQFTRHIDDIAGGAEARCYQSCMRGTEALAPTVRYRCVKSCSLTSA